MRFTILFAGLILCLNAQGQSKVEVSKQDQKPTSYMAHQKTITSEAADIFKNTGATSSTIHKIAFASWPLSKSIIKHNLKTSIDPETGEVIAIHGTIDQVSRFKSHEERCDAYLKTIKDIYKLESVEDQLKATKSESDDKGRIHTYIDQIHHGVKVEGGELTIHEEKGNIYMLQGRVKEIPVSLEVIPTYSLEKVLNSVPGRIQNFVPFSKKVAALFQHKQVNASLLISQIEGTHRLVWKVDIYPTLADRETMLLDAHTGETLKSYKTLCKYHDHTKPIVFDGSAAGVGQDLNGTQQNLNIYQCSDGFFLVDASRAMFKGGSQTSCNDSERLLNGVILTLDAGNRSPTNENFDYDIASSNGANNWNNPTAVSAHINGGRAYEYFKNTFGRESITGNGTNIVSFVNVADDDGSSMDNAFWNGEFIFYGNGNEAFNAPLAKALDVAGHEMSHGVIQSTANLVYQGEPGALNEHFADVFGVMIEREDFRIGEDVTNPALFRTGALRDMGNPNNGGTRIGDNGYQPAHVNEQYRGSEDNGGVHLNSGIPNLAYFTLVTDESFGTDIDDRAGIAERIWYKALTQYLRSNSNFADLRVAVVQAAREDFGATVAAAAGAAFDRVGISASDVTPEAVDLVTNPGEEFVVWSDVGLNSVKLSNNQGVEIGTLSATSHISRPSATDDGRFVIFVNDQKQIQAVEIDWTTTSIVRDFLVGSEPIWRNAVISRDGSKIAGLTGDLSQGEFDNNVIVFDLANGTQREFEFYNPTFSEDVSSIEGVKYADVLEFDHSGEQLIYDAFNELSGTFGQDLSYWDIGIMDVWDNGSSSFGDGNIFKLFSGLPKNVSVGNPTFAKNTPNVIAFDYIETDPLTEEVTNNVLGLDRATGDVNTIYENNTLGYPSYGLDDSNMIFHVENNGIDILAITDIAADRISSVGNVFIFLESADWGVFVGNGDRDLTTATDDITLDEMISIYPNPTSDFLLVTLNESETQKGIFTIYDMQGKMLKRQEIRAHSSIDVSGLSSGTFLVEYRDGQKVSRRKVVKM